MAAVSPYPALFRDSRARGLPDDGLDSIDAVVQLGDVEFERPLASVAQILDVAGCSLGRRPSRARGTGVRSLGQYRSNNP